MVQRARNVAPKGREAQPTKDPIPQGRAPDPDPTEGQFDTLFPLSDQSPSEGTDSITLVDSNTGEVTLEWRAGANPDPEALPTAPLGTTGVASNVELQGGYIRSGNYTAGSLGWNIDYLGNADFNSVTVRGVVNAEDGSSNLMPNGDFETDTTGWTAFFNSVISRITSDHSVGSACLQSVSTSSGNTLIVTPDGTDGIPVLPNTAYRVQGDAKAVNSGQTALLSVGFYDADGTYLGDTSTDFFSVLTSDWTTYLLPFVTPDTTAFVAVTLWWVASSGTQTMKFDNVQLVRTSTITAQTFQTASAGGPRSSLTGSALTFTPGDPADGLEGSIQVGTDSMFFNAPKSTGSQASMTLLSGTIPMLDLNAQPTSDSGESYFGVATDWPVDPALTASTTNPVLGTGGTVKGGLCRIGKRVMATVNIHFGSGGGFTPGSGTYSISMPSISDSTWYGSRHAIGTWTIRDGSSGTVYSGQVRTVGGAATTMVLNLSTGGSVTAANLSGSGNWPAGTDIEISIEYFEA